MRVAIATTTRRRIGGIETYVEALVSALTASGHEVALWHESTVGGTRSPMALPEGVVCRSIGRATLDAAITAWPPDGIVVNGLEDPSLESALLRRAASVFVAHNYHGVCISGTRAWSRPVVRPCTRTFGPGCLAHYFPHRCGGRSLVTMASLYGRERQRHASLKEAAAVVTLSAHMRDVYVANGWDSSRVVYLPFGLEPSATPPVKQPGDSGPLRLATVGRLERLKGVHLLLDALPAVRALTGGNVALTVIGDGTNRADLERQAQATCGTSTGIDVEFTGWLSPEDRDRRLAEATLVVIPSAWPEPLGLVGAEAGALGIPVVAFDVGGIGEWLIHDVNGRLVPGDPPAAPSLAAAVAALANDPPAIARLSRGARELADRRSTRTHAQALADLLVRLRSAAEN
jgi:glycosyltransferase involved in cell wall biosynthesis